jgi:glyoxylase-like metal-dependent hydrolase (beta-lactamase superfamily II)
MPVPKLTVGTIAIIPLSDGVATLPVARFFPTVTAEQWETVREYLNDDGTMTLNFGSFLIHEGDSWTLVDTGWGGREGTGLGGQPGTGGLLLGALERAEVGSDAISRVILTHLHPDHIGWNTVDRDGQPEVLFKNARHVVQRQDWEHFMQPTMMEQRPVLGLCAAPLQDAELLDLVDGDQALSAGITTLLTPGHTPGHQSVLISSGDEQAVILGDVSGGPFQIVHPDWSATSDEDPVLSARTRSALFDRIERHGLKVAAGHYPFPGFGGIVRVEAKRRWQPMSGGAEHRPAANDLRNNDGAEGEP